MKFFSFHDIDYPCIIWANDQTEAEALFKAEIADERNGSISLIDVDDVWAEMKKCYVASISAEPTEINDFGIAGDLLSIINDKSPRIILAKGLD